MQVQPCSTFARYSRPDAAQREAFPLNRTIRHRVVRRGRVADEICPHCRDGLEGLEGLDDFGPERTDELDGECVMDDGVEGRPRTGTPALDGSGWGRDDEVLAGQCGSGGASGSVLSPGLSLTSALEGKPVVERTCEGEEKEAGDVGCTGEEADGWHPM
ncbi:hypothetical protein MMC25_007694 [Agyrium rufum]|nr:hypothetical protein [Agyrium rufum]